MVETDVKQRHLPERAISAPFNASMGFRIRNPRTETALVSEAAAGRDLRAPVEGGLLVAVGERRGGSTARRRSSRRWTKPSDRFGARARIPSKRSPSLRP